MELKPYSELTQNDKWRLGGEYKNYSGKDETVNLLFVVLGLALCFSVPFGIIGFLWINKGELWLISGIVGCALTPILAVFLILTVRLQKKRAVVRAEKAEELKKTYGEATLLSWYEEWHRHVNGIPEPRSAAEIALENAVNRKVNRDLGLDTHYTPSSGESSVRVKLKDGKELHTEERFGDYKTYLYDADGKNTGLHLSGDKVYDDSWHEVGSFDSSGKFTPKD